MVRKGRFWILMDSAAVFLLLGGIVALVIVLERMAGDPAKRSKKARFTARDVEEEKPSQNRTMEDKG